MRFNPFNPQQPARPDFFVGREPEVIEFERFLNQTMNKSPMNISITGNRGMGKTSVLIKFEQIAKDNHCLVVRLSNYEGSIKSIIDFAEYISLNIKTEIISKHPAEKIREWISTIKPMIGWRDFTLTIEKRQLLEELFRKRLCSLWKEVKDEYGAIVLLIDEAEALERIEGATTFLRDVFQRVDEECNYMVVLAGKLNFPERMSESFSPLNRFFPVHRLSAFTYEEIEQYVRHKLTREIVKVDIDNKALSFISMKSEGHPYVLVAMCYIIFESLREDEKSIDMELVNRSWPKIQTKLAQDFFSPMFHPLTKKARSVLMTICKNSKSVNFSFKDAVRLTRMDRNYVSPYIQELFRKGIINKPERAEYHVFHTLFYDFVREIDTAGK